MNLLDVGTAWLRDKLQQHVSNEILFRRGDQTISIFATRGTSTWDAEASDQTVMRVQSSDYICAANQFDDFGLPQEGDLIIDFGKTYELLPVNGGQCFRYSDPARQLIRIHSKQVE